MKTRTQTDKPRKLTRINKCINQELRYACSAIEEQLEELERDSLTAKENLRDLVESSPHVQRQLTALEESMRRQRQRLIGLRKSVHLVIRKRRHFIEGLGVAAQSATASGHSDSALARTSGPREEAPPTQRAVDRVRHSPVNSFREVVRALLMLPKRGVR